MSEGTSAMTTYDAAAQLLADGFIDAEDFAYAVLDAFGESEGAFVLGMVTGAAAALGD